MDRGGFYARWSKEEQKKGGIKEMDEQLHLSVGGGTARPEWCEPESPSWTLQYVFCSLAHKCDEKIKKVGGGGVPKWGNLLIDWCRVSFFLSSLLLVLLLRKLGQLSPLPEYRWSQIHKHTQRTHMFTDVMKRSQKGRLKVVYIP